MKPENTFRQRFHTVSKIDRPRWWKLFDRILGDCPDINVAKEQWDNAEGCARATRDLDECDRERGHLERKICMLKRQIKELRDKNNVNTT